jgi:hypothetical protein
MSASLKRFLGNATLAGVTLILAFGIGEIVARLIYKDETVLFPRYHTAYQYGRYTIRGGPPSASFRHTSVDGSWQFITNSKGFRNTREFPYAKAPGVFRVLSLGDSHTQGFEVHQHQTFSAVLERYLLHRGRKAEVINAGLSGWSTAEALVFLENEGIRYQPDAVVLGFFGNDFEDNLKSGLFSLEADGRLKEASYEHVPGVRLQNLLYSIPGMKWLGENSYFYSLLFNRVWVYFKTRLAQEAAEAGSEVDGVEYAIPTVRIRSKYDIELAAALLERMHAACKERGMRFIVIDIPVRPDYQRYLSSFPPLLLDRLRVKGIELVTSEALFAELDGAVDFHVRHGHSHISELAHALIGAELGRRLASAPGR